MEVKKSKKILYIVAAVVAVIAIVVTGILLASGSATGGAEKSALNKGDKYLANLDYSKAIAAYGEALSLNPDSVQALLGLANAYYGEGDYSSAKQIFDGQLADSQDVDVWRSYATILEAEGDYAGAAGYIDRIIEVTDEDSDYEWRDRVVTKEVAKTFPYAENETFSLYTDGSVVYTKGTNVVGELGTRADLGKRTESSSYTATDLTGNIVSVFSAGHISAAVTEDGELYLTGTNRSSQAGLGKLELIATGTWQKAGIDNVAKVCGSEGTLVVLTKNGELYYSGNNNYYEKGNGWTSAFKKLTSFGTVVDVSCDERGFMMVQTASGRLYTHYEGAASVYVDTVYWNMAGTNVKKASGTNGYYAMLMKDGSLSGSFYNVALPNEWTKTDDGWYYQIKAPYEIKSMALLDRSLYLSDFEGKLHYVSNGVDLELPETDVEHIYSQKGSCVVVFKDKNYKLYDDNGDVK